MTDGATPLSGLRVVEFGSIGPGPHAAMLLSDMGAEILRIEREGGNGWPNPVMDRGRATLSLDIRTAAGRERALTIIDAADVLIEGSRPGVMERLGLGPDVALARNPRLVYGRMTGWGQTGPLACVAGHDLNYIALTGALAAIGPPGTPPPPPLNLIGDFGGGSLFLVTGILAALLERARSGLGQVVNAAIVDGVQSMMAMFAGLVPSGQVDIARDRNILGGTAPFYRCYECADGRYVSVGSLEAKFYAELLDRLGLPSTLAAEQMDVAGWPDMAARFAAIFATRPRDAWCAVLEGTDVCFAPVLDLDEVATHPHMADRGVTIDGVRHAAPAPRLSRTPGRIGADVDPARRLADWGIAS
ncbi:CoA transferase [Sphingomonas ginsenosidivorax]|uniref:CoA transferase n=1 Tax=Sphingomonas ginsenosidivorax TaxID=862135 RepID=A0A5C6UDB6_9SPHN|nr:CaiB/BaiF CoA-transferase family protein [Sphingomonas ginsenosidivorax]TXC70211.1 CoA transferase [Sphingomonas ginsenosidivorax]